MRESSNKYNFVALAMCFFGYFITIDKVNSQVLSTKLYFGAMYYQGDLAPSPIDLSFGPGNMSWGASVGTDLTDWMSINGRFMVGRLTGDDAFARDIGREARNLSFASPLYEYGIYSDFRINKIWKSLDKYKLRLYYTLGMSVTKFDPQVYFNGAWVRLQPLGTEGQTLPGSTKKPYSLSTISRPMGLIIEFDFSKRVCFGMEVTPRKTYTDYLDDVSTTYPNYTDMVSTGNEIGAILSNRRGEFAGTGPEMNAGGTARGNPKNNDWYTHFGVYFKIKFGKLKLPLPTSLDEIIVNPPVVDLP